MAWIMRQSKGRITRLSGPESAQSAGPAVLDRRAFFGLFPVLGLGGSIGARPSAQNTVQKTVTTAVVAEAEKVAGLEFTNAQRELMLDGINQNLERYAALRKLGLPNHVPPAFHFDPVVPGVDVEVEQIQSSLRLARQTIRPAFKDVEELAFLPVTQLSWDML